MEAKSEFPKYTPIYIWDYAFNEIDLAPVTVQDMVDGMKESGLWDLTVTGPDENGDYLIKGIGPREAHIKFDMELGGRGDLDDEDFAAMEYSHDEEDWGPEGEDE
jgi:hypothetical protein